MEKFKIIIEIEDIETELGKLNAELEEIEDTPQTSSPASIGATEVLSKDTITLAIYTGLANLGTTVINDAYQALKAALQQRFGVDSDLVDAYPFLNVKVGINPRAASLDVYAIAIFALIPLFLAFGSLLYYLFSGKLESRDEMGIENISGRITETT